MSLYQINRSKLPEQQVPLQSLLSLLNKKKNSHEIIYVKGQSKQIIIFNICIMQWEFQRNSTYSPWNKFTVFDLIKHRVGASTRANIFS